MYNKWRYKKAIKLSRSKYDKTDLIKVNSIMDLIKRNMFMGDFQQEGGIKLYPMDELETFDIDYEWQFKLGEILYGR